MKLQGKQTAGLRPLSSMSHETMLYCRFFYLFYFILFFHSKHIENLGVFLAVHRRRWQEETLDETSSFSRYRSFPPLFRKLPKNLLFSFENGLKLSYASQVPEKKKTIKKHLIVQNWGDLRNRLLFSKIFTWPFDIQQCLFIMGNFACSSTVFGMINDHQIATLAKLFLGLIGRHSTPIFIQRKV